MAMGVAAFGYLPPVAGALLQEGIDLAVILSAAGAAGLIDVARMRKIRSPKRGGPGTAPSVAGAVGRFALAGLVAFAVVGVVSF